MPLYKPTFGHGGGGIVNPTGTHLSIKAPDGSVVYESGSPVKGTEGSKWVVPIQKIPPGSTFSIDGGPAYTIQDPSQRNEYNPEGGGAPTHVGGSGGGSSGVPGAFAPGNIGFGSTPAYLGNMFPSPVLSALASYKFTNPMDFAKQFGAFNRGEIQKNFDLSKDLALKQLDTELQGLQSFVPAASALKRNEVSLDNQFNQSQRTTQVNSVLPNARTDLDAQAARARTFASGSVPDSIGGGDNALELGIRSAAADKANAGGFGASSSVARKASDLMSTQARIGLSKYGDSLLSSNINQEASLFLAPTEYSNAGSQINVMPSVSASQLIDRNLAQINGITTIPATTGLQSTVQQNQFRTNQVQYNNDLNAGIQNTFALDKFGYQAGFATSVAGAAQLNTNTGLELQQQQMYQQLAQQYQQQAQQTQELQAITSGLGAIFQGFGGFSGIASGLSGLFGSGSGGAMNAGNTSGSLDTNQIGSGLGGQAGAEAGAYYGGPVGAFVGNQVGSYVGNGLQNGLTDVVNGVGSVS